MKKRCNNPNNSRYKTHGSRGIKIEWNNFIEFKNDMYESYLEHVKKFGRGHNTTIDRINNDGNYSKSNCRWATNKEQVRNSRIAHIIEFNGEKKCIKEWSELTKIHHNTLWNRLFVLKGWSVAEALTKNR